MTDSEADIAAIEATLSAAEPAPPKLRATKRAAVKPMAEPDDDEADDGADIPPAPVVALSAGVTVPGLPSVEEVPAVVEAMAAVSRLAEQRAGVEVEIAQAEAALGLKPGASARDFEQLAVRLLVEGKSDNTPMLESLRVRQRRLTTAGEIATKALNDARAKARRELSAAAAEAEYLPAARASALALLELIRCKVAEEDARDRLRAGGFGSANGTFASDGILDPFNNPTLIHLVRNGHLTRAEVQSVCRHMSI